MIQTMPQHSDISAHLPDATLSAYFRSAGDMLSDESALLGAVIRNIIATDGNLTNKAIILRLINALESTDDVVTSDIIRKTLEIVVNHTTDDL
jgi:hypothetical protein